MGLDQGKRTRECPGAAAELEFKGAVVSEYLGQRVPPFLLGERGRVAGWREDPWPLTEDRGPGYRMVASSRCLHADTQCFVTTGSQLPTALTLLRARL